MEDQYKKTKENLELFMEMLEDKALSLSESGIAPNEEIRRLYKNALDIKQILDCNFNDNYGDSQLKIVSKIADKYK